MRFILDHIVFLYLLACFGKIGAYCIFKGEHKECKNTKTQKRKNAKMQKCKNAKTQKRKNAKTQKRKNANAIEIRCVNGR
jgi:hypothetical protein